MRPNRKWNRIKNKIVELNILIVNIKSALARLFTLNLLVGASPHDRHHRSSSQCYRKSMIFTLARKRNHKVENSKWRCSSPSTFRLGKELMVIFKRDFNGKQCKTIDGELSLSYRSWCFRRRKKKLKNHRQTRNPFMMLEISRTETCRCRGLSSLSSLSVFIFLHALSHGWISAVCCARMEINIFEIHSGALNSPAAWRRERGRKR